MPKLTDRQRETLKWIKAFIRKHEMPPTVRELARALGIKSSSAFHLLARLERKGYIKRGAMGARSLKVLGSGTRRKPQ